MCSLVDGAFNSLVYFFVQVTKEAKDSVDGGEEFWIWQLFSYRTESPSPESMYFSSTCPCSPQINRHLRLDTDESMYFSSTCHCSPQINRHLRLDTDTNSWFARLVMAQPLDEYRLAGRHFNKPKIKNYRSVGTGNLICTVFTAFLRANADQNSWQNSRSRQTHIEKYKYLLIT